MKKVKKLCSLSSPSGPPRRIGAVANEVRLSRGVVEAIARSSAGHSLTSFRTERMAITFTLGALQMPHNAPGAVRFEREFVEKQ